MHILFLTKAPKTYNGEQTASLTNVAEKLSACRKLKLDPSLSLCSGINSMWIKDLNFRPETDVSIGKSREYSGSNRYRQVPLQNSSNPATKRKNGQMGLHEINKLLHKKINGL
jgi:hypothetical protein